MLEYLFAKTTVNFSYFISLLSYNLQIICFCTVFAPAVPSMAVNAIAKLVVSSKTIQTPFEFFLFSGLSQDKKSKKDFFKF